MDEPRTVRFVTPTFFFVGSLVLGAWRTFPGGLDVVKSLSAGAVAAIAASVVAAMFPLGFAITSVSTLVLRFGFLLFTRYNYQIRLSEDGWKEVWRRLALPDAVEKSPANQVSAAITFDHEILKAGTHAALFRLWSAFNVCVNSCTALLLAFFVGYCFAHLRLSFDWLFANSVLFALFLMSAIITWRDHMALLELQCHRTTTPSGSESEKA